MDVKSAISTFLDLMRSLVQAMGCIGSPAEEEAMWKGAGGKADNYSGR